MELNDDFIFRAKDKHELIHSFNAEILNGSKFEIKARIFNLKKRFSGYEGLVEFRGKMVKALWNTKGRSLKIEDNDYSYSRCDYDLIFRLPPPNNEN